MQKYVNKILTGADLTMTDGRKVRVVSVGDFEPADPSVGIMSGFCCVTGDDGQDYEVMDNGDVYRSDPEWVKVGTGPSLEPDEPN